MKIFEYTEDINVDTAHISDELSERVGVDQKEAAYRCGEQNAHAHAFVRQIDDAQITAHGAAAGKLRDKQVGNGVQQRGREHQNRENHAVDRAVGGHCRVRRAAVACETVGNK